MKGDSKVIAKLNEVLTGELTAINQYFLHAKICKNWGYESLAKKIYHESIDEMKHAETLTDRILFLEGMPNLQKVSPLRIGENVKEQLESDLDLEKQAIKRIREAIQTCFDAKDHGSRELLEKMIVDEEGHADWLEAQLNLIDQVGYENYLAKNI